MRVATLDHHLGTRQSAVLLSQADEVADLISSLEFWLVSPADPVRQIIMVIVSRQIDHQPEMFRIAERAWYDGVYTYTVYVYRHVVLVVSLSSQRKAL